MDFDITAIFMALDLILNDGWTRALLVLVAANFLLAVVQAIMAGEFSWERLDLVYQKDIVAKILGFIVVRLLIFGMAWAASVAPEIKGLIDGSLAASAFAIIAASLVARIMAHLRELGLLSEGRHNGPAASL